ncbi:MAG: MMPL family transporter [Thermomicrobiales bacterium]
MTGSAFYRFGLFLARWRWPVVIAWIVLIVIAGYFASQFHNRLTSPTFTTTGSESERVTQLLEDQFAQSFTEQDLIVFESDSLTASDPAFQQVVQTASAAVAEQEGVVVVISPFEEGAQRQISDDGHAAYALVGLQGSVDQRLERVDGYAEAAMAAQTDDVRVMFTGRSPVSNALITVAQNDLEQSETIGLPVALLILLIAFGTLIAAGMPLAAALAGIALTFGTLTIASEFTSFNLLIENVISMIGLAVGIDYTLFIITRFREELNHGRDVPAAVGIATATAGKTVLFSGMTVLISVSGLLIVRAPTFQQIAIGMMAVVPVMVAIALTLLPAMLAILGHWVNRVSIPYLRGAVENPDPETGVWAKWAHLIMGRPVIWAAGTAILLIVLAAPVLGLSLGVSLDAGAAKGMPAGDGFNVLNERFSPGELSPIQVLYQSQDGQLSDGDLDRIADLTARLQNDPAVAQVQSITSILDAAVGGHTAADLQAALSDPQMGERLGLLVNVSGEGNLALVNVVPTVAPDSTEAYDLVERIRDDMIPAVNQGNAAAILVGGFSGEIVDVSQEVLAKFPYVIGFVLGLSFLLLMMIFRSLLLPLKAIIMNLLSVGAAYGLLVLVFQEGWGEGIFGFDSTGIIQVDLPLFTFAILFGLSMDYEVFLLSRVKEEWEKTGDTNEAVAYGLEHTARTITSAAAIMVAVFTAFAFTSLLEVQQIGFALAVAILVDASLIRILLVPATMRLMGHWNWWLPGWLDRRLPQIPLSETSPA